MMTDSGDTATIIDFDAQTIGTVNKSQKTWSVVKFSEMAQRVKGADIDVKKTRQKKMINGFNASETVIDDGCGQSADEPGGHQAGRTPSGASGGGSLFEMTMESSDFSTSGIPDSVFAIPAGFRRK
jgi:hypothetical protein